MCRAPRATRPKSACSANRPTDSSLQPGLRAQSPAIEETLARMRVFGQREEERAMTTMAMPRRHGDRGMEGMVAKWYAANTGEMMKEYVDLARRIAGEIAQGSAVLEVAPGPGYFCIELARLGSYAITGLDISRTFVKMAGKRAAAAGVRVEFEQGSATNMPFPKESFDFLLCRAAFKNFADPVGALKEMRRVLKPGGRGLIIDLKREASPAEVSDEVDGMGLSP